MTKLQLMRSNEALRKERDKLKTDNATLDRTVDLWKMTSEDWKRRWEAITDKFNLNVLANAHLKTDNDRLRLYIAELERKVTYADR